MRSALLLAAALGALAPGGAQAATRYVSPGGAGEGTCVRTAPCSVAWAINGGGSADGDTVVVLPGRYADQPVLVPRPLTITASRESARPVMATAAADGVTFTIGQGAAGTVVEHLAIRATGSGSVAVDVQEAAVLDEVAVTSAGMACLRSSATGLRIESSTFRQTAVSTAPCLQASGSDTSWTDVAVAALNGATAASMVGNSRITDATFTARSTGLLLGGGAQVHRITAVGADFGVRLSGSSVVTDSVVLARRGGTALYAGGGAHQLLNVTAIGSQPGSHGIRAANGAELSVKNTIARGSAGDLAADPATDTIGPDCVSLSGCPAGRLTVSNSNYRRAQGVTDAGSNQSGTPLFVDATFEDFHLRRASPAIDAGNFEFNAGSADRDGLYRWLGKAPDMGAYEFPAPRKARPRTDTTAPRLKVLRLYPLRFRARSGGTAFSAAGRTASGTTLSFRVTENAEVVVNVSRRRGAPILGTIVRPFKLGTRRMSISGELDGRLLNPGRYVFTVMARDVAQNLSRPRRFSVTVVR